MKSRLHYSTKLEKGLLCGDDALNEIFEADGVRL